MSNGKPSQTTKEQAVSRRAALAKLGLGAAVAYTAPTVMHLDRNANAVVQPSPCSNQGKGQGIPAWCRRR
jgi:hypothetical protein